MKSNEKLRESYEIQKRAFDEAEARRVKTAEKEIEVWKNKIESLQSLIEKNSYRLKAREFETFESFRNKAYEKSIKSKNEKVSS